jgi:hypothetical protein
MPDNACINPSLRAVRSAARQSILSRSEKKDGLLRYARNDGAMRPGGFEHRALLKAVKDATRRLRRSPAAILDRFSQRAILNPAGTEKRPFQPNKETKTRDLSKRFVDARI